MARKKSLPTKIDEAGKVIRLNRNSGNELDYSALGIDGEERRSFSSDSFCQSPEYELDEFH
jgi:hypothetical protein